MEEQACIREQAADCLLDGKQARSFLLSEVKNAKTSCTPEVPEDLVRRYNKACGEGVGRLQGGGGGGVFIEILHGLRVGGGGGACFPCWKVSLALAALSLRSSGPAIQDTSGPPRGKSEGLSALGVGHIGSQQLHSKMRTHARKATGKWIGQLRRRLARNAQQCLACEALERP